MLAYSSGAKYDGKWKDCKRHGKGVYTRTDGRKYDGEWKAGKEHGEGMLTGTDGDVVHDGEWKNGLTLKTFPEAKQTTGKCAGKYDTLLAELCVVKFYKE